MEPVKKEPIVNQVAQRVLDHIRNEGLTYDSKLPPEHALCQQLNVARSSLREAYRILQAQGFITIKPGRGAFVSSPLMNADITFQNNWFSQNKVKYLDLLEARQGIEVFAIRLAVNRISNRGLALLANNLEQFFLLMSDTNNYKQLAELDQEFHAIIFEESGNSVLININEYISKELIIFRYSLMKMQPRLKNTYLPHCQIFDALKIRDEQLCIERMRTHLEIAQQDINEIADQTQ